MWRMLWWHPNSIHNPIFFSLLNNEKWVFMKYFTQEVRHGALLFLDSTNEIHFYVHGKTKSAGQIKTVKKNFLSVNT